MKTIPLHSLVIMVGPTRAGKSKLANKRFPDYEILSTKTIRKELTGDSERSDINYEVMSEIKRRTDLKLKLGERVVVDASELRDNDRKRIAFIGSDARAPVFYIVCDRPLKDKLDGKNDKEIERQDHAFNCAERKILQGDGVAEVVDTRIDDFELIQKFPDTDWQDILKEKGYRGITAMGDVHGTLEAMKSAINWARARRNFIVFLGDIVDYGPKPLECIEMVYEIVMRNEGMIIYGNHERKIERWINQSASGNIKVRLSEGNKITIRALQALGNKPRRRWERMFKALAAHSRNHLVVSNLVFTHAATLPEMFELYDRRLPHRSELETFALFGQIDSTKKFKENGYPNRIYDWVDLIPDGKIAIVGHDMRSIRNPVEEDGKLGGHAIFLDTGSGKGGHLTSADIRFTDDNVLKVLHFNWH